MVELLGHCGWLACCSFGWVLFWLSRAEYKCELEKRQFQRGDL